MPQELQVLQCFTCETFQVDIVKKVSKWTCKLCGEKQSIKKIYGKGSGKECRQFVQSLNEQRLIKQRTLEHASTETNVKDTLSDPPAPTVLEEVAFNSVNFTTKKKSKWAEFSENVDSSQKILADTNISSSDMQVVAFNTNKTADSNIFEDKNNDFDAILDL